MPDCCHRSASSCRDAPDATLLPLERCHRIPLQPSRQWRLLSLSLHLAAMAALFLTALPAFVLWPAILLTGLHALHDLRRDQGATLHYCAALNQWRLDSTDTAVHDKRRGSQNMSLIGATYRSALLLQLCFVDQQGGTRLLRIPADAVSASDYSYLALKSQPTHDQQTS